MVLRMDPGAPAEARPMPAPPVFSPPAGAQSYPSPPWVEAPPRRAGQLAPAWRVMFGIGWAAIVVGHVAVWESSRVIGLSTWWLGADAEPRFLLLQLLPFYGPLLVTTATVAKWRYLPYLGIVVAAGSAAIGAGDLGRVRWIAAVELVLAGAALCISVASLAGMYRPAGKSDPARGQ